jgi:hypothetical protein
MSRQGLNPPGEFLVEQRPSCQFTEKAIHDPAL